jgi:hypothetical protein
MASMAAVSCSRRLNMVKWPQTVPVSRYFAPGMRLSSGVFGSRRLGDHDR